MPGVIDNIPSHPWTPRYSPRMKILRIEAVAGTPAKKADVGAGPIFFTAIVTSKSPIRFGTIPWNIIWVNKSIFEMDEKLLGKKIIQRGIYIKKLIKAVQKMSSGIVIFHALLTTM